MFHFGALLRTTANMDSTLACNECYMLFDPFVGQEQAAILAAHAPCPNASPSKSQKQRKQVATRFSKRRRTFIKRAHDLQRDCDVDVYVVIRNRKNRQLWKYTNGYEPPSRDELVSDQSGRFVSSFPYSNSCLGIFVSCTDPP